MLDITLLQIIKTRTNYDKYRYMIRDHLVDDSTKKLIHDLKPTSIITKHTKKLTGTCFLHGLSRCVIRI